jgi:hypothetical protein
VQHERSSFGAELRAKVLELRPPKPPTPKASLIVGEAPSTLDAADAERRGGAARPTLSVAAARRRARVRER